MALVQLLEQFHYPQDGSSWQSYHHPNPSWLTVLEKFKLLDRNEFPFIWLHISDYVDGEMPEHGLSVMGGRGEYTFDMWLPGSYLRYFDSSRPNEVIQIWESDQGDFPSKQFCCDNLEFVIKITEHFFRTGEAYPHVTWVKE
jgi:hypothetical protein